jgi:nucleoside phosphorylase
VSRVGIVAALVAEARALDTRIRQGTAPSILDDGTLVVISGVGAVAASGASHRLAAAGATGLVSFGLAGGLDPGLAAGAIFLPTEVVSGEGLSVATSDSWRERLANALAEQHPRCEGSLLSSAAPVADAGDKALARARTGAAAVDMESLAIGQVAAARALPFLAVRVIVDTAEDTLPKSVVAASGGGEIRTGLMLRGLLRAPADVIGVMRLALRFRVASRALRRVAQVAMLREV